jgi:pimeloyl-ACP methyl ester carboxylesterase
MQVIQGVTGVKLLRRSPRKKDYPLFIYLPGMDGTGELFHTQTNSLEPYFEVVSVAILPNNLSNWESLSNSIIELIKIELKQRNNPRIYLCGESFGGCLALKIWTFAPDLLEKIILVNPASSFNRQPLLNLGIPLTQWIPEFLYQGTTSVLLPFLGSLERMKEGDRIKLLKAMNSLPLNTVNWRLSLLRDFAVKLEELTRLKQPVLILASRGDLLLPSLEEAQRLLNYLKRGYLEILPNSGHACLLEKDVNLYELLISNNFI